MRIIPNARSIALRSYALWVNRLGLAVLVLPEVWYWYAEFDVISPQARFILGVGLMLLAEVVRYLDQGLDFMRLRSPMVVGLIAMSMLFPRESADPEPTGAAYTIADFDAVAVPLIAKWEGLRTTAYLDPIASPPVWTVCYGETKGVQQGDSYTEQQCREMLAQEVREYRDGLHAYFTPETKAQRLTAHRDAAYTSLAYNAGVRAIGNSTATRRLNAGDIAGGCEAIAWWNKAGQRVIRGLVNRRAEEVALCRRGLV